MGNPDRESTAGAIRRLVAELDGTPLGERLRDRAFRQRHAVEALLHSPDPLLHEIGAQVRDGTMSLRDVLKSETYVNAFLDAGTRARQQLSPEQVAQGLSGLVTRARAEQHRGPADQPGNDPRDRRTR